MATLKQMKQAAANLRAWREHDKVHGLVMVWIAYKDGTHTTLNSHTYEADATKQLEDWEGRYPHLDIRCARIPLETVHKMVADSVSMRLEA